MLNIMLSFLKKKKKKKMAKINIIFFTLFKDDSIILSIKHKFSMMNEYYYNFLQDNHRIHYVPRIQ